MSVAPDGKKKPSEASLISVSDDAEEEKA